MENQEYHKVHSDLKSLILGGHYAAGQKLAPERKLCQQYQVSRITVRHALRLLEEGGLVERFQGKGTFVKNTKPAKLPITEIGFAKSVKQYAPGLYRNLLKHEITEPPESVLDALGLDSGQCFLGVRADILNGDVIAFDRAYIRQEHSASIDTELLKQVDFFEKWTENEKLEIAFYHESIEAIEADHEIASILEVKQGQAVLKSTEIYHTADSKPVAVFESFYRGDKIKLTSTINFKGKANVKVSDNKR
jgi:GntR family transcriptional regulator